MGAILKVEDIEKRELKKHVAAIRVSNTVGLLGRKIWNVLLLNAYDDLLNESPHTIPISILSETVGYNSHSYESLQDSLKRLQTTLVQWDIGGGCEVNGMWSKNYISAQMLGVFKIKDGVLEYYYPHLLPELLYNPEMYQQINLSQQKQFSSAASLALWENCIRYIGVGSTGLSDVDEWREIFGVMDKKTYSVFFRFNDKIIKPSMKEVNDRSMIDLELMTEKRGRKIVKMGFKVKEKKQRSLFSEHLDTIKSSSEYIDLLTFSIHKVQALKWIEEHGYNYIRDKISLLQTELKTHDIKNPSGWLVKAINEDFQDSRKIKKEQDKRTARQKLLEEKKAKQLQEKTEALEREFRKQAVQKFIDSFSPKEQEEMLHKVKQENPLLQASIKSLDSPFCLAFVLPQIPHYEQNKQAYLKKHLN